MDAIKGNLVDVFRREIYPAEIEIKNGIIENIKRLDKEFESYIIPGLVDSHIHIESTMLTPSEFARIAVGFGTVAVVSDPHEIANVAGVRGIDFMIRDGETVPLKFFFGVPSCVPATKFETAGAEIGPAEVGNLIQRDDLYFLSEVMNFPGVINNDPDVIEKIKHAHAQMKPVDGHAPGLNGADLEKYVKAGITTDHECISLEESEEKIRQGMKIQIREGSAARGFDIFSSLIDKYPDSVMLCTDDIHPDDLLCGHINRLLSRGVKSGLDIYNLIRVASVNPVIHYGLPVGLLRIGDYADMAVVDNLENFNIIQTYINGRKVFNNGKPGFPAAGGKLEIPVSSRHISAADLAVPSYGNKIRVIKVNDGELYTGTDFLEASVENGYSIADPGRDILKIVVVNRYRESKPAIGFIKGFGLKKGAIAGSVAHDSHNIIAVGANDNDIVMAINNIIDMNGGLTVVSSGEKTSLELEIGGLMTSRSGSEVAGQYQKLDALVKEFGCILKAPFMSLSFMALLVIPELKISDRGLFDVSRFTFTSLFEE